MDKNVEKCKYDLEISSKKGTTKFNGVSFGKLMYELNKYYLKYDHRTLDENMVKFSLQFSDTIIWGDFGCGSKLNVVIKTAEAA